MLFHSSLVFCTNWIFFSNIYQQFNIKEISALSGSLYSLCSKIFLPAWVPAFKNHGSFSTFSTIFPSLDFNYLIKPLHNIHSIVYINLYLTGTCYWASDSSSDSMKCVWQSHTREWNWEFCLHSLASCTFPANVCMSNCSTLIKMTMLNQLQ